MKGLKKTFILALCLLSCVCFYAEGAKIVNTIGRGKPLSFWTKWDANEGYCPGAKEFVADADGNFYLYARTVQNETAECPLAWYKVSGKKVTEIIRSDNWEGDGFSYLGKGVSIFGIVNSWKEESETYFIKIHAEINGKSNDYEVEQPDRFIIQDSEPAYYTDGMLFVFDIDGSFLRIELKDDKECVLDFDNTLFMDFYREDFDLKLYRHYYKFAEWKFYDYIGINGYLTDKKDFDEPGYYCYGYDDKGNVYYVKNESVPVERAEAGIEYKCKVAVLDIWENEIHFYDDLPLGDWNPPRTIDDWALKEDDWIVYVDTIGFFPWTLSPDGNIYFMDLDRRTNEYVIKKVDNLWEKDLKAKEKAIGTVTKNRIPLYKEASLDAENDGYNFENDFVWVKQTKDNWSYIQKIDGREGWIPSEYVRF